MRQSTNPSGRITTATVWSAEGSSKTVPGAVLRQILGYDVFRSTLVTLTVEPDGTYRFDGKGWGHGFGMSQDGAVAMIQRSVLLLKQRPHPLTD